MQEIQRHGFDPWVRKIPPRVENGNYSRILPWKIPWTEEPGGPQSMEWPKELGMTEHIHIHTHTHTHTHTQYIYIYIS